MVTNGVVFDQNPVAIKALGGERVAASAEQSTRTFIAMVRWAKSIPFRPMSFHAAPLISNGSEREPRQSNH